MRDLFVDDISTDDLADHYDIALVCFSEEVRCSMALKHLLLRPARRFSKVVVIHEGALPEKARLQYPWCELSQAAGSVQWIRLAPDKADGLSALLSDVDTSEGSPLRLFLDYSSMWPSWYAAVLGWARRLEGKNRVSIDTWYTVPEYLPEARFAPLDLDDVPLVPGCEGRSETGESPKLAVFGLGFDGVVAFEVFEMLQQPTLYAYYASPVPLTGYAERALEQNHELVQYSKITVPLPLCSVRQTYSYLAELVADAMLKYGECVLVPMGPKPHVLAAIMAAMQSGTASCLHPMGRREREISTNPSDLQVLSTLWLRPRR